MAELLSVHVHIPRKDDIWQLKSQSGLSRNSSAPQFDKQKYDLPKKRNLDIEFKDLKYTVKDGHHKKGKEKFHFDLPNEIISNFICSNRSR
jgi:hypothetical protein